MALKIAIAGSSQYSQQMAETLAADQHFQIEWILTPRAKKVGRQQILTSNPLTQWADQMAIEKIEIEKKIDQNIEKQLSAKKIDFLLVVDFGYLVPQWLLDLAKIAPLNIHPSKLPLWRGSSPGQFAILWQDLVRPWQGEVIGGKNSAITLMTMNTKLDEGDIITQFDFEINKNWSQKEYYDHAFNLMAKNISQSILDFADGKIKAQAQAKKSPSPIARRLSKTDSFIAWDKLKSLIDGQKIEATTAEGLLEKLLTVQGCLGEYKLNQNEQLMLVANACLAFKPWPGLWTIVSTTQGKKRMKILNCHLENEQLVLDQVQIEGKTACPFKDLSQFLKI